MENEEKVDSGARYSRDYLAVCILIVALAAFVVTGYFSLKTLTRAGTFDQLTAMPEWIKNAEKYGEELLETLTKGGELRTRKARDVKDTIRRGHRFYQNKKFREALNEYDRAVKAEPGNPEAYFWRGRAFLNTGQIDPAADDFKTALKLKPDYSEAYDNLGWVSAKRGEYDQGISYLTRSLELKPENGWAHYNRGQMLLKKGDLENSLKDFEKACKLGFQEGCKSYEEHRDKTRIKEGGMKGPSRFKSDGPAWTPWNGRNGTNGRQINVTVQPLKSVSNSVGV